MKCFPAIFAVAACVVLLSGCGSDSGTIYQTAVPTPIPTVTPSPSPSPTPIPASRYAGVWSGPFTLSTGQTGLAEIVVSEDGSILGRAISTTAGSTDGDEGAFTGNIDLNNGTSGITIVYKGTPFSGDGSFRLDAASDSADDRLTGTLTRFINGVERGSVTVTLKRGQLPKS